MVSCLATPTVGTPTWKREDRGFSGALVHLGQKRGKGLRQREMRAWRRRSVM